MLFGYADCKSNKHGPRAHNTQSIPFLCKGENQGTVLELVLQYFRN